MATVEKHSRYLFVFAHPDDEVYTAGLIHRLVTTGKAVTTVFLTNGDAGANAEDRETELAKSMKVIGINPENTVKLGFLEKNVLRSLTAVSIALDGIVEELRPTCVLGMDFEGGHIIHDSASFVTAHIVGKYRLPHYVFPVYHLQNGQRKAALFISGRETTDVIDLSPEEALVKIRVLEAHAGQANHFLRLKQQDNTYLGRLKSQEIYRRIETPIDFSQPPTIELGYLRSGVSFEDFQVAVRSVS